MRQKRVYTIPQLISSSGSAIGGASIHGAGINLLHNTAPAIAADRNAFIVSRNTYEACREELSKRRADLDQGIEITREFVTLVRELLKPKLGKKYSQRWDVTGFKGSLRVPSKAGDLIAMLIAMEAYLEANPGSNNDQLNIKAARAAEIGTALTEALNDVNAHIAEATRLLQLRNVAMEKLQRRMRGMVAELTQLISGLDARWVSFGLVRPGIKERPDAPEEVSVVHENETTLQVKWDKVPRAKHYRLWVRVEGRDDAALPVGSPKDPGFTIPDLPLGALVEISLSAVGAGGESARSESVRWRMGDRTE